jgi:hypothetical protein
MTSCNCYLLPVLQGQNDFLREWLPKRESFLQLLLMLEIRPGNGKCDDCTINDSEFRCSDCMGDLVHCHKCVLQQHRHLPFHRIERWNGKFFARTTLFKQGYVLHLGHRGQPCPATLLFNDEWMDVDEGRQDVDGAYIFEDETRGVNEGNLQDGVVDIIHTTGVFRNNIRWCQCQEAPAKDVQLFQMQLFPASHHRPQTAFTFDCLEYFYTDAMECKTPASSFMRKICRLTNNPFPHTVPVCPSTLPVSMFHLYSS